MISSPFLTNGLHMMFWNIIEMYRVINRLRFVFGYFLHCSNAAVKPVTFWLYLYISGGVISSERARVNGKVMGQGSGHTKKAAEQAAAYQAIRVLRK